MIATMIQMGPEICQVVTISYNPLFFVGFVLSPVTKQVTNPCTHLSSFISIITIKKIDMHYIMYIYIEGKTTGHDMEKELKLSRLLRIYSGNTMETQGNMHTHTHMKI